MRVGSADAEFVFFGANGDAGGDTLTASGPPNLLLVVMDDVGVDVAEPFLDALEPGFQGVDVPGGEAHGARPYPLATRS